MQLEACVANCTICHQVCLDTVARAHPDPLPPTVLRLLIDCAQICQTSAGFLSRRSPFFSLACAVSAEICAECATVCEGLDGESMEACVDICRRCAESCRQMALEFA